MVTDGIDPGYFCDKGKVKAIDFWWQFSIFITDYNNQKVMVKILSTQIIGLTAQN